MSLSKRKYPGKDVEMLTIASIIMENALNHQDFLQSKRTNWTEDYFLSIVEDIQTAMEEQLGTDTAKKLRETTREINKIQKEVLGKLSELKIQIKEDFKAEPEQQKDILQQLGFSYHNTAGKGDQEALVQLLYQYNAGLTPELSARLTDKGISPVLLEDLKKYAEVLNHTNISQESLKAARKNATAQNIETYNDIYSRVISIAKIAKIFFQGQPRIQEQFSYQKLMKKLNFSSTKQSVETEIRE